MPAITYDAFLAWGNNSAGLLILIASKLIQLEQAETMLERWALVRNLAVTFGLEGLGTTHLEALIELSALNYPPGHAAKQEEQILQAVNEPIETGATVERETRDAAWLKKIFDATNWYVAMIDGACEPVAATASVSPAVLEQAEPGNSAEEPITSDGSLDVVPTPPDIDAGRKHA